VDVCASFTVLMAVATNCRLCVVNEQWVPSMPSGKDRRLPSDKRCNLDSFVHHFGLESSWAEDLLLILLLLPVGSIAPLVHHPTELVQYDE
jgi:hypothetical protein